MSKGQTLQDPFLNSLRKDRIPVSIFLVNGIKLQGHIESFDQYVVLLKNTVSQMVYKHAISTVVPARNPRTAGTPTGTGFGQTTGEMPTGGMGFERPAGFDLPQYGGASRGGFGTVTSRTPSFANNRNERGFDNNFDGEQRAFGNSPSGGAGFDRSNFAGRGFDEGFDNKSFDKGYDNKFDNKAFDDNAGFDAHDED